MIVYCECVIEVNTLLLHVLEQIEMHVFGGTACFGLISVIVQLTKSVLCLGVLSGLAGVAHAANRESTQTAVFSVFVAVAVALAYVLSRWVEQ